MTAPLRQDVWIDAPREEVFDYFTDAEKLVRWMGGKATLDPVAGGEYAVLFKEGWVSRGRFVVVNRPERIVYTVGWEGHETFPPGSTRVEILFIPENGGTRVRLKHYGPPRLGIESSGWAQYLQRLASVVAGCAPAKDPFESLLPPEDRK